jgi:hypothetical protein
LMDDLTKWLKLKTNWFNQLKAANFNIFPDQISLKKSGPFNRTLNGPDYIRSTLLY